ncbi:MAG TPA: glycosyltransferase family 2 protein [Verrucomicrobiae bacterium]|nr:glycosyltransferase family 2 protein [Verrucomicrobiae bacterium]
MAHSAPSPLPDLPPAISVVVPCRNECAHIADCLGSILRQQEPPGGFEVIVADGMSDDGTREILRDLAQIDPRLRIVDNPRRVTPSGMNCGIRAARGHWLAILGSHNRYAPDYLRRCLETAQRTHADNVGGAMFAEATGLLPSAIAAAHHSPFSVGGARWHNPQYEGPADTVFGGFYARTVFEKIGLFDEQLARNQDDELNLRLTRSGGLIWQSPLIKSWYSPRSSLVALFRQYQQYGYWKVRVIQKHRLPASWRHLVPVTFILCLLTLAVLAGTANLAARLGWWPPLPGLVAATILSGLLALYGLGLVLASLATARKSGWTLLPVLPPVFACYHFGYGLGFLRGIWDFLLWHRQPASAFTQLTRA